MARPTWPNMLEAMPGFVNHAVLTAGAWDISTVATGYFYGPLDIAVDQSGTPHIAWHNHDQEDEAYAVLSDGQWATQIVHHDGHDGWDNSLALDSAGRPHTASIDPSQFGSQSGVEYATFDGSSWQVEEVGSGPTPYEFGTAIVVDSLDRPHVAWYENAGKDLKYAVKEEGVWRITTVDDAGDTGRFPSMVLDQQDNPLISYYAPTGSTAGTIKLARWNGSEWDTQEIDSLDNVFPGFHGARRTSSVSLGPDGDPLVAYADEGVLKVAWLDGSQWIAETVMRAGDLPLGQQVSLAVDASGVLHLTFSDDTVKGGPGVVGSVKYARGTLTGS